MSLLELRLREVVDHELLVVQTDGKAFKGRLVEFDDEFILLHDCLETSTTEVNWKNILVPVPVPKEKIISPDNVGAMSYGEKKKNMAMLKKVMINVHQVIRIWLWDPETYNPKEFDGAGVISF